MALAAVTGVVVIGTGIYVASVLTRDKPERYANILDHFKYGSIGSEATAGVPYDIWLVLPKVFEDRLPKGRGEGWERLGFIYEPGRIRPIGTTLRENEIEQLGLNCAVCHTSILRDSPSAKPRTVLGGPANVFNLQAYINFLRATGKDPRFTPGKLIPAIKKANPDFSLKDELLYRHLVIPRTREALKLIDGQFAWLDSRPDEGPGRVDTFNPYKVMFEIGKNDTTVGTVDLPSLWNQRPRQRMQLHWDGNNDSVQERNISAAIGAGVQPGNPPNKVPFYEEEDSLDEPSMRRVYQWILDLKAPRFPRDRIDQTKVARGAQVYEAGCSACHSFTGPRVGKVTSIADIGTDRERLDSFTPELSRYMNTLGTGRPWRFTRFRKTNGYANAPLDGIWLRAPYLHNGSVPDLASLLMPPKQRPKVFFTGYDVYDFKRVGFITQGPAALRAGFRYDTSDRGNGNGGHLYGTDLPPRDKAALLEYLKTE